jgi:hypothetical protein
MLGSQKADRPIGLRPEPAAAVRAGKRSTRPLQAFDDRSIGVGGRTIVRPAEAIAFMHQHRSHARRSSFSARVVASSSAEQKDRTVWSGRPNRAKGAPHRPAALRPVLHISRAGRVGATTLIGFVPARSANAGRLRSDSSKSGARPGSGAISQHLRTPFNSFGRMCAPGRTDAFQERSLLAQPTPSPEVRFPVLSTRSRGRSRRLASGRFRSSDGRSSRAPSV